MLDICTKYNILYLLIFTQTYYNLKENIPLLASRSIGLLVVYFIDSHWELAVLQQQLTQTTNRQYVSILLGRNDFL